jgi:cardiolipin synthase
VSEASPAQKGEQGRTGWTAADLMSFLRIPLAAAFVLVSHTGWRLAIVAAAAVTDLLDGPLARRRGSSAYGPVLDPIADKVFMAAAVGVVAFSGRLAPYEIIGVLLRDIVATVAFVATFFSDQPRAIPARWSGKAVTVAQILTLVAFLLSSPYLRPIAWATTVIAVIAIWDYQRVAPRAQRRVGHLCGRPSGSSSPGRRDCGSPGAHRRVRQRPSTARMSPLPVRC